MERLLLQQSAAYIQFINSLRSKDTKIHYTNWLNDFLKYLNISCDRILDFDSNQLQQKTSLKLIPVLPRFLKIS